MLRNGRPADETMPARHSHLARGKKPARRNVFGYFGNLSPYKGIRVAPEAAKELSKDQDFVLHVHGGMPFQTETSRRKSTHCPAPPARRSSATVPIAGTRWRSCSVPDWVITPSIWWETLRW